MLGKERYAVAVFFPHLAVLCTREILQSKAKQDLRVKNKHNARDLHAPYPTVGRIIILCRCFSEIIVRDKILKSRRARD